MLNILYMMTLTTTLSFFWTNHPISMGFILLMKTILIATITGMMTLNFWFSYILFMIMIGGMLVLFIYMTSVASNEKFSYSNKFTIMILVLLMITLNLALIDSMMFNTTSKMDDLSLTLSTLTYKINLTKYINWPSNMMMIMMIIYLLVTLIAVVKITNISYGALRQKF